jgi:molybdopterin-guanine dinucleotide biosynthesis protein A
MNAELITSIVNYSSDRKIIVSRADGFVQNLIGLYPKETTDIIESIVANIMDEEIRDSHQIKRKCRITTLINSYPSLIIEDTTTLGGYTPESFLNMNNKDDLHQIRKILEEK